MYSSVEIKFKVTDIFDKNNKYHMWIIAAAVALGDLTKINKMLLSAKGASERIYLFKINVGHLREAYHLIREGLKDDAIKEYISRNTSAVNLLDEVSKICDGEDKNSFAYKVLRESRHKIFHYTDIAKDANIALEEYEIDGFRSSIKLGYELLSNDYVFADEVQLNLVLNYSESYKLNTEEFIDKITMLTVKIMQVLNYLITEFIEKVSPNKYYVVANK